MRLHKLTYVQNGLFYLTTLHVAGSLAMYGENQQLVIDQPIEIDTQPEELECLKIFY